MTGFNNKASSSTVLCQRTAPRCAGSSIKYVGNGIERGHRGQVEGGLPQSRSHLCGRAL